MINHSVTHFYQPTNNSCSQASMATLLSFFGSTATPQQVMDDVPVNRDESGKEIGTINQDLATWAVTQGYAVDMYSADFQILDLAWQGLDRKELLERLQESAGKHIVGNLGERWSGVYLKSYIDFLERGGYLHIVPYFDSELLDQLLLKGPVLAAVSYNVLYGVGRRKNIGLRKSTADDVAGNLMTHSLVLYGKDDSGQYLAADPWEEPGLHKFRTERLLAAMAAAQVECDNLIFQLRKKQTRGD